MEFFGYADEGLLPEKIVPSRLAEVTLNATPSELLRMADFLIFCAREMERMGTSYDHTHLSDKFREFRNSPHFVVSRLA